MGKKSSRKRGVTREETLAEIGERMQLAENEFEVDDDEGLVSREEARNERALLDEDVGPSDQSDASDISDDEEIDSDEAFDSEDERKFGDFDFTKVKRRRKGRGGSGQSESEDEYSEEEEEEEEEEDSEDEERHREMLANLRQLREENEAEEGEDNPTRQRQAKLSAPKLDDDSMQEALTLSDLVSTWKDSDEGKTSSRNRKLEKSLKRLTPTAAPLPKVVQDRNERKAAYQISSKDVSKWQNIVKLNREARTLEFSNRQTKQLQLVSTTAGLANNVKPETDMEKEIAQMLTQELNEDKVGGDQDLPSNELSKEEMQERQAKLAKMRSVLFYHDQKAKRLKAIKSKRHHKYLKNVEKRKIEKEGLNMDPEALKKEMEHAEFLRAKERLTLKHKNTSKWAKRALQRGFNKLDEKTKMGLSEQNQISEALKRKVNYQEDSSDEYSSSGEEEDVENGKEGRSASQKIDNKAKAEVLRLLEENPDAALPKKGLFSLPFMARAINKQKDDARQKAEDFLMELENDEEEEEEEEVPRGNGDSGLLSFGNGKGEKKGTKQRDFSSEEDEDDSEMDSEEDNTASAGQNVGDKRKKNAQMSDARTTVASTSRGGGAEDSFVGSELDLPQDRANKRSKKTKARPTPAKEKEEVAEEDLNLSDDDDVQDGEPGGLSQREIVSQAFGAFGDDVQTDFLQEKMQDVTDELPTFDEPADLPGWGKWEADRKTPKWILKARAKAENERRAAIASRKDRKLKLVMISERYDKKSSKYTTDSVPFPFKKKEDYERSIRTPLGSDFNSEKSHRDLTRPDILTTTGVRIDPIAYTKSNSNPNKESGISNVRKF